MEALPAEELRMRSEQVRSNRGCADSKHTWIGKVDLNVSVACMVHRLVLTVGGTGIGGLATRSWPRFPSR